MTVKSIEELIEEVRAERPEVEDIRNRDARHCVDLDSTTYDKSRLWAMKDRRSLLAVVNDLQRAEAAWRNARDCWQAETDRYKDALATANANHERFERLWYLEKDKAEAAEARITELQRNQQGRTSEQYAIEHGRYLATAAQHFMESCNAVWSAQQAVDEDETDTENEAAGLLNRRDEAQEAQSEAWRGLENAIYEFTKRADRALAAETQRISAALALPQTEQKP